MSPQHFATQTIRYEQRADDISTIGQVIELLGNKNVVDALEILMAYRNQLIDAQRPRVEVYDPSKERHT